MNVGDYTTVSTANNWNDTAGSDKTDSNRSNGTAARQISDTQSTLYEKDARQR